MIDRRALLTLAAASGLAACAPRRVEIAEGAAHGREGGIGGTGIVGVVTGLGSLRVNGLRVGLDRAAITDAFGARAADALGVGHSMTILAASDRGALRAVRAHLSQPLVGPVTRVAPDGGAFEALGATVRLEPGLRFDGRPGDRVAVSGLWRGATVVASRIDPAPPGGRDALAGVLTLGPEGPAIQGVPLRLPADAAAAGGYATALGVARDGVLEAETLAPGRFPGEGPALTTLSVEGYLEPVPAPPGYEVSGLGHSFDPGARLAPLAGGRALFVGPYDGLFAVARALPLPEAPAERRRLLAAPDPLARPEAVITR